MNMMNALISERFGDPDSTAVREVTLPETGDGDVRIRVAACGLNFPDLLILDGKYQFSPELPFIPGGEVTGVVVEAGSAAQEFYPGQRVFAIERWGGLAEQMVLPKNRVFPLSDAMGLKEGASLLYNFSTALYALKNRGKAKEGQTLLILGAAGGVGLAAVQMGKIYGLKVIAAAGSHESLALCASFGADELIHYREENIRDRMNVITGKRGTDLVLDTVGGRFSEPAVRSLAWGGKYLVVGFAAGEIPAVPLNLLLLKGAEMKGVFWGKFSREEPLKQQENVEEIFRHYTAGRIRVCIGREYPLEEAAQALKDYRERKIRGKAVVICSPELVDAPVPAPGGALSGGVSAGAGNRGTDLVPDTVGGRFSEPASASSTPFRFLSPEHVLESAGVFLGESRWFQVTQEVINDFADATGDHQWIHILGEKAVVAPGPDVPLTEGKVTDVPARDTPAPGDPVAGIPVAGTPVAGTPAAGVAPAPTIAHGFLTLSLAPKFLSEIYEMPFVRMGINYGVDKLRFLAPVKVNSEIRMTARLLTADPVRNGGIKMRIAATYFVKGTEKPVCSAELLSVIY